MNACPKPAARGSATLVLRLDLLAALAMAVALGGVIGLERELKGKPAGLRTNILICLGATLFTDLSRQLAGAGGDPARIAAQILPGVGFIGAGTILHARGSITGLTSAATIWIVAAIGMALGAHAYVEAFGTAVLVIVVLQGLGFVESLIERRLSRTRLVIHVRPDGVDQVLDVLRRTGLEIVESERRQEAGPDAVLDVQLRGARSLHAEARTALIHHAAVRSVSAGE